MVTKKMTVKTAPPEADTKTFQVRDGEHGVRKGMTRSQLMATLTSGSYLGAVSLKAFSGCGSELAVTDMFDAVKTAGDEAVAGNLSRVERVLMNQVLTLDSIFNNLAERSTRQEYLKNMETYLRLALKAQTQARATAETLALLKNPQPYIKQANIAQGHQQVNNTYASTSVHSDKLAGAENSQSEPNKLLETDHGQRMDIGAQSQTGRVNQTVAAVG
jgi:hypothetical protein